MTSSAVGGSFSISEKSGVMRSTPRSVSAGKHTPQSTRSRAFGDWTRRQFIPKTPVPPIDNTRTNGSEYVARGVSVMIILKLWAFVMPYMAIAPRLWRSMYCRRPQRRVKMRSITPMIGLYSISWLDGILRTMRSHSIEMTFGFIPFHGSMGFCARGRARCVGVPSK